MKIRILYPTVTQAHGIDAPAGEVVNVDTELAEALITEGAAEPADAKPPVEQATAAPGESRPVRARKAAE